jgi:hypothetical protein
VLIVLFIFFYLQEKPQSKQKSNEQEIQELRDKLEQLQFNTNSQTKTVKAMIQTVQFPCEHHIDVSTRKVAPVTTGKWAEIPPAINIANVRPSNVGL